jgi:hypothetical protein
LGGSTAPLHRPAQAAEHLNIFTLEIFAQVLSLKQRLHYKSIYERHADQSHPNGKIIGYSSLDHNKVVQRRNSRKGAALTNPIAQHRITRSEFPSHHDGIRY